MVNCTIMLSQQDNVECAMIAPVNAPESNCPQTGSSDPAILDQYDPIVINVKFWGINRPNGENDYPNRREESLTAIANLNIYYNPYKIYFKYKGYAEFDSPIHYWDMDDDGIDDPDSNGFYILERDYDHIRDLEEWARTNGKKDPNAINVYLTGWNLGFAGWGGFPDRFTVGMRSGESLAAPLMLHEMGHALTLKHTRSSQENVTREEFLPNGDPNPDYNAKTAGDSVEDTAANPGFSHGGNYPYLVNCVYQPGSEFDSTGTDYVPASDDVANILTDAYPCVDFIVTAGQGIRAREALACGDYAPAVGTIASLYEPYTGGYYLGAPVQEGPPLFQPGFTYRFVECDCQYGPGDPNPTEFGDTDFTYNSFNVVSSFSKTETNYSSIIHPNHTAIDIVGDPSALTSQPWRCYDFVNGTPIGGRVTRFNDNVFNANVTITPKDSIGINNQNLVNDLPNGLYTIDQQFGDGSTEQTVIQKGNNN